MTLDNIKITFFSITVLIIISIYSPVIIENFPSTKEENFFALTLLGNEGFAENYFPGEVPIVYPDTIVKWRIHVFNHMGEVKQIKIKIKLIDVFTPPPNITTCTPSPSTEIFQIRRIILNNETMIIPLEWSISEVNETTESYQISLMEMNNYPLSTDITIEKEKALKMVLELWVYDETTGNFVFNWSEKGETRCVWNQIQFHLRMRTA